MAIVEDGVAAVCWAVSKDEWLRKQDKYEILVEVGSLLGKDGI